MYIEFNNNDRYINYMNNIIKNEFITIHRIMLIKLFSITEILLNTYQIKKSTTTAQSISLSI